MNSSNAMDSWPDEEIPGLWSSSINYARCCIYRVPKPLRRVNPEAYTPQMLLIGPLHHSKKFVKTDSRYVDYINMEHYKIKYLKEVADKWGTQTVEEFRKIIKENEQLIRESYAESTEWIKSKEFVEMILRDAVFILRFINHPLDAILTRDRPRDILLDQPSLLSIILDDLLLLENQLPFAILTEIFDPFFIKIKLRQTFREQIINFFDYIGKIERDVKILHLTDLLRHVRVMTLGRPERQIDIPTPRMLLPGELIYAYPWEKIKPRLNADKLNCAGVEFVGSTDERGTSLVINFEGGILTMPFFIVDERNEKLLRKHNGTRAISLLFLSLCL